MRCAAVSPLNGSWAHLVRRRVRLKGRKSINHRGRAGKQDANSGKAEPACPVHAVVSQCSADRSTQEIRSHEYGIEPAPGLRMQGEYACLVGNQSGTIAQVEQH